MRNQTWKQTEKRAAEMFNGKRNISRMSNYNISEPDITIPAPFTVECKQRKHLPKWATQVLEQAQSYAPDKTPIGYLHEKYKKRAIIVMYSDDFSDWFGDIITRPIDIEDN